MTAPQRKTEDVLAVGRVNNQMSLQNPESLGADDLAEREMLRFRIKEQSGLICMLKDRADKTLLKNRALQKISSDLEEQAVHCQKELDVERKRAEMLEKRFADLASNNEAISSFMEDYKKQNIQLKLENKQLQIENASHVSDKEILIQKFTQDIDLLKEELTNSKNELRKKLAESVSKLREKTAQHQAEEAWLHSRILEVQQQHTETVETCKGLKLKLEEAKEQLSLKENDMKESIANLAKEKDKLHDVLVEREKALQEEIQELEIKMIEEKEARIKAEDRFELEAAAVNADERVKSLQAALNKSVEKFRILNLDFDAFREHSAYLIRREKDLNNIFSK